MLQKLILVYGLFGHICPNRLYTGERFFKKKRNFFPSFILSIDKQELKILVLTVWTIEQDYIVLDSLWQIIEFPACSMKGLLT